MMSPCLFKKMFKRVKELDSVQSEESFYAMRASQELLRKD